jgi:hypothetical protein
MELLKQVISGHFKDCGFCSMALSSFAFSDARRESNSDATLRTQAFSVLYGLEKEHYRGAREVSGKAVAWFG